MGKLDNVHALVTGGGTGVGAAIARQLTAEGARVTLAGRRREPLEEVAREIGPAAAVVTADVTSEADCTAMAAAAREAHGPIDIVIANAGAAESAAISSVDLAHWQRMIDVNLTGTFLTIKSSLSDITRPLEIELGSRRIILVSSTAGLKGYPYVAPYVAAKHGVVGLARALAQELARTPVTVNAVCPGFTDTPLLDASIKTIVAKTGRGEDDARKALVRANPQGRFVDPLEVAATVAWLCLPSSQAINGQAIAIAGGEV